MQRFTASPRPARAGAAAAEAGDVALDAALTALGRAVSQVAHELRNGLWNLDLALRALDEALDEPARARAHLAEAVGAAARLRALAGNVLAIARGRRLAPDPVDFRVACREALDGVACFLRGAGIELTVRDDGRPAPGRGGAARVQQVLLNLVLNALEAMPTGGRLAIRLATRGGRFTLTVRDTGRGMDRATLARATEPFFTTRPNGTGLGLAIVQDTVTALGGDLELASRPGRGTRVRVTLPLSPTP